MPRKTKNAVTLPELIRSRMAELGLTFRTAADESRVGTAISSGTLHKYAQGTDQTPDAVTVKGIALAIEVDVQQVEEALGLPVSLGPFYVPAEADRLTRAERQIILDMIHALLEARRDGRAARPARRATG